MKTAGVKDDGNGIWRLLRDVTTKKGRQKIEGHVVVRSGGLI